MRRKIAGKAPSLPASGDVSDALEGLMEGFVAYDANWVMTYMNAAGERLTRRRREDVLGKTWQEAFPHAVGNPVDHMYRRVMRTRVPERMEYFYPHYGHWFEISASPMSNGGVAVYFRDITDRVRADQELREADRRKHEFLATLAHELRNPLAPLANGLHLLRMAKEAPWLADEALAMMERQMSHLVRLVDDLLEVSRISRGKLELRKERVDLGAVVAAALETSRPAIDAAGHALKVELCAEPVVLEADAVRLAQVIANLLNNAAKYTPRGGQVALLVQRDVDSAVIRVRDSGVGIPREMLSSVFDMFTQVEAARSQGGLGIGLTLAKRLIELHGGTIEAVSEGPGTGAEFLVRLPLRSRLGVQPGEDADVLDGAAA